MLTSTADAIGLSAALSVALLPWRKPHAVHDPGKVLLDLARPCGDRLMPSRTDYRPDMTIQQISLGAFNTQAEHPAALAEFWAAVTGAKPATGGESVYLPAAGPTGFAIFFQPLTGPRPDNQVSHLDLTVPWGSRQPEVDRLISLGATHQWDVLDEFPHVKWTTLTDPEGNLFCLAEHPPAG